MRYYSFSIPFNHPINKIWSVATQKDVNYEKNEGRKWEISINLLDFLKRHDKWYVEEPTDYYNKVCQVP